jgi:hypothetical protein
MTADIQLAGVVALDEDDDIIWGSGKTEHDAHRDAWRNLGLERPKRGARLDYWECTEALLDYLCKHGGSGLPYKQFEHPQYGVCLALKEETIAFEPTRCPDTMDMFAEPKA